MKSPPEPAIVHAAVNVRSPIAATGTGVGRYRWRICGLLFFATTLNYMDRQVLALLKPTLQNPVHGIGLTEIQSRFSPRPMRLDC
jgi:ACS family hexuronate transporter-like MFS transporter